MKSDLWRNHIIYMVCGPLIIILSLIFTKEWNQDYGFMSNVIYGYIFEWNCNLQSTGGYSGGFVEVCDSHLPTKVVLAIGFILSGVGLFLRFSKSDKS